MSESHFIPRILIIDDLFGRTHPHCRNEERANLCGQYLLEDITGDEVGKGPSQKIKRPIAQAVFFRGQKPTTSTIGDIVENDLEGTLRIIQDGWVKDPSNNPHWAMVLLDLCFYTGQVTQESNKKALGMPEGREEDDDPPRYFGLNILQAIQYQFPDLPVIILSSKSRDTVSRDYSFKGALGFLPREDELGPELLREYLWRHGLIPDDEGEMTGRSKVLLLALRAARRAASERRNILLRGERGTGKDLLANYIHRQTQSRASNRLIVINSSTLTPELFASELFGIEARRATGVEKSDGLIVEADGGDLFFDEIRDMHPQVQAGILRVLENREVIPVGGKKSRHVDVRFLSATNVDIEALAAGGNFRHDLLDRLREGGTVYLAPLRDRKEDIPLLIKKFVRDAEQIHPSPLYRHVEPEVLEKCCIYDWPGNIRELRDYILNAIKNNPDVEYLVPSHVQLPLTKKYSAASQESQVQTASSVDNSDQGTHILDELLHSLSTFTFDSTKPSLLIGKLAEIQGAYAHLITRYLKAALEATSKTTPENPKGKVLIHPAIKLITGDSKTSASKAADIVKKLLGMSPEAVKSRLSDTTLNEAYKTAMRLRPSQQKSKRKSKS